MCDAMSDRARRFCLSDMTRVDEDLQAHSLFNDDYSIVALLIEHVLQLLMKNNNVHISLNKQGPTKINTEDVYWFVAGLLL